MTLLYSTIACVVGVTVVPAFVEHATHLEKMCWLVGGLSYIVGGVIYAFQIPDPWPETFGYHEVFHLLTAVAAICTWITNCSVIARF